MLKQLSKIGIFPLLLIASLALLLSLTIPQSLQIIKGRAQSPFTNCSSEINLSLIDMYGKRLRTSTPITWEIGTTKGVIDKTKTQNTLSITNNTLSKPSTLAIRLDDGKRIVAAKLDNTVLKTKDNALILPSFCGKKNIIALVDVRSTRAAIIQSKSIKIKDSCNKLCEFANDSCGSGYMCVNTCRLDAKSICPQSTQGVCRAVSCIKDSGCGCVRGPTPTPFLHGVKGSLRFTGGVQPGRTVWFFNRLTGTEHLRGNYRGLEHFEITKDTYDYSFNPQTDFSANWFDFTIYSDKQIVSNYSHTELEPFPVGTKIIYTGPCKPDSKEDECNLHLDVDGGTLRVDIEVRFPPIDEKKTGNTKIKLIADGPVLTYDKFLKFTVCRVNQNTNRCLPNASETRTAFMSSNDQSSKNDPDAQRYVLLEGLKPGKYLVTADTNIYDYENGPSIPLPDQTGINPIETCDEFGSNHLECLFWLRDGVTRTVYYYLLSPSTYGRGLTSLDIYMYGLKPFQGMAGEITLCKWSLKNKIGECQNPVKSPTTRYYEHQNISFPDLTFGRYVAILTDGYYREENGEIDTIKLPFPENTTFRSDSNVVGDFFTDKRHIVFDLNSSVDTYFNTGFAVDLPQNGQESRIIVHFDSNIESLVGDKGGLIFDACPIIDTVPDCSKQISTFLPLAGYMKIDALQFTHSFYSLAPGPYSITPRKGIYDATGELLVEPTSTLIRKSCSSPLGEISCVINYGDRPIFEYQFRQPSHIKGQLTIKNSTTEQFNVSDVDFNICRNDRGQKQCVLAKTKPTNTTQLRKINQKEWLVTFEFNEDATGKISSNSNYGIQSIITLNNGKRPITFFHQYVSPPSDDLSLQANIVTSSLLPEQRIKRNVLLIKQNPYLPTLGKRLFDEYFTYVNLDTLANNVVTAVNEAAPLSDYSIKKVIDLDTLTPVSGPGLSTSHEEDLVACAQFVNDTNQACKRLQSRSIDYVKLFRDQKICEDVNNGTIDEVWSIHLPYTGMGEGDMVGPNPYFINGFVVRDLDCHRNVPVLSIDITRNEYEAVHSLGHRMESTMSLIYKTSKWEYPPKNNFERYVINASTEGSPPAFGCGNIHFPPNALKDYEYLNSNEVPSYCDTYLNYPLVDVRNTKPVSFSTWGQTAGGYYQWWFTHLPITEGTGPDGVLQNWWKYFYDPDFTAREAGVQAIKAYNQEMNGKRHDHFINE